MRKQKIKAQWANRSKVNEGAFIRLEFDMSRIETPSRMAKMSLIQMVFWVTLRKRFEDVLSCWYQVDVTTNGVLAIAVGIDVVDDKTPQYIFDAARELLEVGGYDDWKQLEMFELAKICMNCREELDENCYLLAKVGLPYSRGLVVRNEVDQVSIAEYASFFQQVVYSGYCNVIVYADTLQAEAIKLRLSGLFDWSEFSLGSQNAIRTVSGSYSASMKARDDSLKALYSKLYQLKAMACSPLVIDAICTTKYLAEAYNIDCSIWLSRNGLYLLSNRKLQNDLCDEAGLYQSVARERAFDLSKLPVTYNSYCWIKEFAGMSQKSFNYLDATRFLYDMMISVSADTFNAGLISPKDIFEGISLSTPHGVRSFLERFDVNKNQESLTLLQCCYYQQPYKYTGINLDDEHSSADIVRMAEMMHTLMTPSE